MKTHSSALSWCLLHWLHMNVQLPVCRSIGAWGGTWAEQLRRLSCICKDSWTVWLCQSLTPGVSRFLLMSGNNTDTNHTVQGLLSFLSSCHLCTSHLSVLWYHDVKDYKFWLTPYHDVRLHACFICARSCPPVNGCCQERNRTMFSSAK